MAKNHQIDFDWLEQQGAPAASEGTRRGQPDRYSAKTFWLDSQMHAAFKLICTREGVDMSTVADRLIEAWLRARVRCQEGQNPAQALLGSMDSMLQDEPGG